IGHNIEMFAAPVAPRRTHSALHFVEDKKNVVFVANPPQFLQPLTAEMIIAAFALDRLNDNGTDVDPPLVDEVPDLALGYLFARDHIGFAFRFRHRKIDVWT